ncbi:MAG: ferritin-like domain-containing protein [Alphaproteobacteria bacterium]|nr:ferritin-like domain-containing protein [Alphaproteobacteria bacterium]
MKNLEELYVSTLNDVYYAENKILRELPTMINKAHSAELKEALQHHFHETQGQLQRLEQCFNLIDAPIKAKKCEAIEGISKEAKEDLDAAKEPHVLDAALVGCAQAIEHYEISRYGTLVAWAKKLGQEKAASLLEQTLEEEKNADATLTGIALGGLNDMANMRHAA